MSEIKQIAPQEGFQTDFLSSEADIVIGGSGAGVGKTFALLIEFLRHTDNSGWGGNIFRRTMPQIKGTGGLWDTSMDLYPQIGGTPIQSKAKWVFPSGAELTFAHMEYEKDKLNWQGTQIPFIGFDELTHFSKSQFFYLLSRNRSVCGVNPYVRCTCNPDPDSWVASFISWWIDDESGFPIPEREGVLRYFVTDGGNEVWGDTKQEVIDKCPHIFNNPDLKDIDPEDMVKSVTFISGKITDNKELLKVNPQYLGNLLALPEDERIALLDGNWKHKIDETDLISAVKLKDVFTNSFVQPGQPAITADIAHMGADKFIVCVWKGFVMIDIEIRDKTMPDEVERLIKQLAEENSVPRSRIAYDADGLGDYLQGYLKNAIPVKNNSKPIKVDGIEENYLNLKSQLYFNLAKRIKANGYYITEKVANKMHNNKNVRSYFEFERKAIKRGKTDHDGKIQLIPKEKMKNILQGKSTDFFDSMSLRERLELKTFQMFAI